MARSLIVNADDLGASEGVNRGIVECHCHGIVTSASLMVTGAAVHDAVALAGKLPNLAIGLHFDVFGEDERKFDLTDVPAIRAEFAGQLERFESLLGRLPTHLDSHRHVHREPRLLPLFRELVEPFGLPLRGDGQVRYVGHFYAQWEWKVTDLARVSVAHLLELLRTHVREDWTEIACHPGYRSPGYRAVYLHEREAEVRTLVDPRVRQAVTEEGIRLASYADFAVRR